MKKQYLIGLLGVAAISVPMGNSLLTVNNSSSIPAEDSTTMVESGVAITESSISFYDLDQDDNINKDDSIAEVNIEGTIGTPEDGYEIDQADGSLYIYDDSKVEPDVNVKEYSIDELIANDNFETSDENSSFTFNKEASSDDPQYLVKDGQDENYVVAFALDMNKTPDGGVQVIGDSKLGSVDGNLSFNSGDLIDNTATERNVKAEEVIVDKDASTASITYDITLLSDVDFASEEIATIEWIDLGEDGLLDEEQETQVGPGPDADPNKDTVIDVNGRVDLTSTSGTLTRDIVPEEEYNKSLIKVTTSARVNNTIESNIVEGYNVNTVPPVVDDDNDKMGGGAIFGIIVAVALGVGIIGYGAYYLYKKYAVN